VPLARLIETTIQSEGQNARPTLESAQPVKIAAPPKTETIAPSIWAHGPRPEAASNDRVRPLILPDMSGAVPVQPTFDPRVAHVDYAEGLARRQQAERAAAAKLAPIFSAEDSFAPQRAQSAPRRTSKALLVAFAAFAVLIAATLFCAGVLMLQQNAGAARASAYSSQPARAKSEPQKARPSLANASKPSGEVAALPESTPAKPAAKSEDKSDGIPVLAVDSLPKVANSRGILHVGKQFDGHRVFIDGAVVSNGIQVEGGRDYDLSCGTHGVKIGSQDRTHPIVMPCGGELTLQ